MAENVLIDESVEGKGVLDADGETIGIVSGVRNGTAFVDPDHGITNTIRSTLGWNDVNEDDYPLREAMIERITDDKVHLRRDI